MIASTNHNTTAQTVYETTLSKNIPIVQASDLEAVSFMVKEG